MKIQEALQQGFLFLQTLSVETAMLDCVVLLTEALGISKEKLYTITGEEIDDAAFAQFKHFLEEREKGLPVSYIRHKKEFYDLEFYVDQRVLVPRPETELIIETALNILEIHSDFLSIHDLCTGTGCIPITLKSLNNSLKVSGSDISGDALAVFKINSLKILGAEIPALQSDLFEYIKDTFHIITANPPYIKDCEYEQMKNNRWPEPALALNGGSDGLDITTRIIEAAPRFLKPGGYLILESGFDSFEKIHYIMNRTNYKEISIKKDLAGKDRVITGRIF